MESNNECKGCKYENRYCTEIPCNICRDTALTDDQKTQSSLLYKDKIEKVADSNKNVVHPTHYNAGNRKECWDEMIEIFGADAVAIFDCLSAYKYDYRAGSKADNPKEQDLAKIDTYINHADSFDNLSTYAKFVLLRLKEVLIVK